jgi:translocation and assembly module TamA
MFNRFTLLILFFLISPFASSNALVVKISDDLPRHLIKNIHAYLGTLPANEAERSSFIFTANKQTENALKALGYYRAVVTNSINKNLDKDVWTLSISVLLNEPTKIKSVSISLTGEALGDEAFKNTFQNVPIVKGDTLHHGV